MTFVRDEGEAKLEETKKKKQKKVKENTKSQKEKQKKEKEKVKEKEKKKEKKKRLSEASALPLMDFGVRMSKTKKLCKKRLGVTWCGVLLSRGMLFSRLPQCLPPNTWRGLQTKALERLKPLFCLF